MTLSQLLSANIPSYFQCIVTNLFHFASALIAVHSNQLTVLSSARWRFYRPP